MSGITDSARFNNSSNYFISADPIGNIPQTISGNLLVTGNTATGTISGAAGGTLPVTGGLSVTGNAGVSGSLTSATFNCGGNVVTGGSLGAGALTVAGSAIFNGGVTVTGATNMQAASCTSLAVSGTSNLGSLSNITANNTIPQAGMGTPGAFVSITVPAGTLVTQAVIGNKCYFTLNVSGNTPAICVFSVTRDPALPNGIPIITNLTQISASGTWLEAPTTNPINGTATVTLTGSGGGIGTPCSAVYQFVCVWV